MWGWGLYSLKNGFLTEQFDVLFRDALWWLAERKLFQQNIFLVKHILSDRIFTTIWMNTGEMLGHNDGKILQLKVCTVFGFPKLFILGFGLNTVAETRNVFSTHISFSYLPIRQSDFIKPKFKIIKIFFRFTWIVSENMGLQNTFPNDCSRHSTCLETVAASCIAFSL